MKGFADRTGADDQFVNNSATPGETKRNKMEKKEHKKGTTTTGVVCKDAVVLAADQLSSIGDFRFNLDSTKIFKISDNIAITTAGAVGDNQTIIRIMKAQLALYELEVSRPTVNAAVTLLSNILSEKFQYTYLPFSLFDLVGGYDTKPRLFSIDPIGGSQEETKYASTGSGMIVAYGILDKHWKENMSIEEGIKLAVQSIVAARTRVSSVGGESIMVFVVAKDGIKQVPKDKVEVIIKESK